MLDAWNDKDLTPEERHAANLVVDLDAEQTTCPACLETIRPEADHCPACGLRLG